MNRTRFSHIAALGALVAASARFEAAGVGDGRPSTAMVHDVTHAVRVEEANCEERFRASAQSDTQRFNGATAPHPNTTKPTEILANIKAAVQETDLAVVMGIPELAMGRNELRAARILDVTSLASRPDYFVVELETHRGVPVAVVAITKPGVIISAGDVRGVPYRRALSLDEARRHVKTLTAAAIRSARYVWTPTFAEPGSSIYKPLAAVETAQGTIYFNSSGEAFAETGSPILDEVGPENPDEAFPPGVKQLRKLRKR